MSGWAWTSIAILLALLAVQSWYFTEQVWEMNRRHQRHLEEIRLEYWAQDQMLKELTLPMVMVKETDDEN